MLLWVILYQEMANDAELISHNLGTVIIVGKSVASVRSLRSHRAYLGSRSPIIINMYMYMLNSSLTSGPSQFRVRSCDGYVPLLRSSLSCDGDLTMVCTKRDSLTFVLVLSTSSLPCLLAAGRLSFLLGQLVHLPKVRTSNRNSPCPILLQSVLSVVPPLSVYDFIIALLVSSFASPYI